MKAQREISWLSTEDTKIHRVMNFCLGSRYYWL
jgi:hypothetical protein